MTSTTSSSLSPSRTLTPTSSPLHSSISGPAYLTALSSFIKTHEQALANYYQPRPPRNVKAAHAPPSWTTVLTLGIVPTAESSSPSSTPPPPRRDPLVLKFDPHHLYYLLLKFDELGISGAGELDVKVDGGTSRPMSVDYSSLPFPPGGAGTGGGSVLGGMFGLGGAGPPKADDARSVTSGISSFSFGSGWWGLGSGGAAQKEQQDEATDVRYIYSSCTKLPALKLSPFLLTSAPTVASGKKDTTPALVRAVEGFEDCPPPSTCVPLGAFKNLSSLILEDLDPRGFLGWDVLSVQLRSLEVHRGGIEDIGELICDAPTEDEKRRMATEWRGRAVGSERRRRAEGSASTGEGEDLLATSGEAPPSPATASYPTPSKLAWSSLRHLSLSDNSLTFIPSPPLSFLPTLTSLDLSSNLLISIPPGLSHLTSLRSLNLSDNMIDSLLGVSRALGAIEVLNLSNNRLENLSGLDRLPALERLDVRDNQLYEALEISRVARLPHLREVWVKGNPFARKREESSGRGSAGGEEGWRVKVFSYFEEEEQHGHRDLAAGEIKVDGTGMTSQERRVVEAESSRRGAPARRRASTGAQGAERVAETRGGEAKVVGRRVVTAPHRPHHSHHRPSSPPPPLPSTFTAAAADSHSSDNTAGPPSGSATKPVIPKPKRRKPRRVVDLDASPTSASHPLPPPSSSSAGQFSDSDPTSSGADLPRNALVSRGERPSIVVEESTSTSTDDALSASPRVSSSPPNTFSKHQRYASSPSTSRLSASASASNPSPRAARVSASTYEPPTFTGGEAEAAEKSGEAFRRKIEKLRDEVGESWLSVLGEREARSDREKEALARGEGAIAEAPAPPGMDETEVSTPAEENGGKETAAAEGQPTEVEAEAPQVKQGVKVVQKKKGGKGKGKKKK
jgi:hypothetical protein